MTCEWAEPAVAVCSPDCQQLSCTVFNMAAGASDIWCYFNEKCLSALTSEGWINIWRRTSKLQLIHNYKICFCVSKTHFPSIFQLYSRLQELIEPVKDCQTGCQSQAGPWSLTTWWVTSLCGHHVLRYSLQYSAVRELAAAARDGNKVYTALHTDLMGINSFYIMLTDKYFETEIVALLQRLSFK